MLVILIERDVAPLVTESKHAPANKKDNLRVPFFSPIVVALIFLEYAFVDGLSSGQEHDIVSTHLSDI